MGWAFQGGFLMLNNIILNAIHEPEPNKTATLFLNAIAYFARALCYAMWLMKIGYVNNVTM